MKTFIFGHKNPDTDSVISSIALSYLKNKLGGNTIPRVLGNINKETKFVLNYFNIEVPSYLNDVKVRIKDTKFDKKAYIYENESIDMAFNTMQEHNITAIPLVNENKLLSGYVTLKEIARYLIDGNKRNIATTLDNIVKTLDANIICSYEEHIAGNIIVAGMKSTEFTDKITLTNNDILIVGDRYRILDYAITSNVKLIILPYNSGINEELLNKAKENKINIIETSLDSYIISNKILLSNFIKSINTNLNPITVNIDDYFSDFKTMTHKINHTNYPVINKKGECVGLIRLTGPNDFEKQKVILVDHNNFAQSVDGIEEADIVEIIDHHNLGAIGTTMPINFRSRPVGCTSTMIYDLYKESNVEIPKHIAGIMLSAILSDTLVLTSPTTTEIDKFAAVKLSEIAGLDINSYGVEMLTAASSIKDMSIQEVITSDFKRFDVDGETLGIGQVMTMDIDDIKNHIDEYISELNKMVDNNYNYALLFVTDIIKHGSYVLYNDKSKDIIENAFGINNIEQCKFIPKIMSRKKQILPNVLNAIENK